MKKKDFILLALFLAAGLIMMLFMLFINQKGQGENSSSDFLLKITVDNKEYGEYPLDEDQTIKINDTNVCRIEDGIVSMTEADCPDLICVNTAPIKAPGKAIVCLPNKVVLEIVAADGETNDSEAPDVVVK